MVGSNGAPRVLLVGADEAGGALLATWLERGGCQVLVSEALHGIVDAHALVDLAIVACATVSDDVLPDCSIFKKGLGSLAPDLMMLNDGTATAEVERIYESGVDLLVPLPSCELELVKPALLLIDRVREKHKLRYQHERSKGEAFDSMRESERLRQLVHVVSEFIGVKSYAELTSTLFKFTQGWGYGCSVVVHDDGQHFYFADDGALHPFEQELAVTFWESVYNAQSCQENVVQNEDRFIVSFEKITVLVRRVPKGQVGLLLHALTCLSDSLSKAIEAVSFMQQSRSEKVSPKRALDFLQYDALDMMARGAFGAQ